MKDRVTCPGFALPNCLSFGVLLDKTGSVLGSVKGAPGICPKEFPSGKSFFPDVEATGFLSGNEEQHQGAGGIRNRVDPWLTDQHSDGRKKSPEHKCANEYQPHEQGLMNHVYKQTVAACKV